MTRFLVFKQCGTGCPFYQATIPGQARCSATETEITIEDQKFPFPTWCPLQESNVLLDVIDIFANFSELRGETSPRDTRKRKYLSNKRSEAWQIIDDTFNAKGDASDGR